MLLRLLYSFLWYCAIPFIIARLFWRSRGQAGYRQRIHERFGLIKAPAQADGIWLHTVSVGEFIAAKPLIEQLLKNYPDKILTITTMTPSGSEQVEKNYGTHARVHHVYMPYDTPAAVQRFLAKIQPKLALFMETELWLNAFYFCQKKNIPVYLLNARLSARSAKRYQRFSAFSRLLLSKITHIAVQNQQDGERFVRLGFAAEQLTVCGSIKFDITFSDEIIQQGQALRQQLGAERPVWLVASTHEGEELIISKLLPKLQAIVPDLLTLIVPRHVDRFDRVAALFEQAGFQLLRRSQTKEQLGDLAVRDIYLADTMGELPIFYAAADVAFVAGSLVPVGGHNILEPIALNIPTITGPQMFNFAEITRQMLAANALLQVQQPQELIAVVSQLLTDKTASIAMQQAGQVVMAQNKGALDKMMRLIASQLSL